MKNRYEAFIKMNHDDARVDEVQDACDSAIDNLLRWEDVLSMQFRRLDVDVEPFASIGTITVEIDGHTICLSVLGPDPSECVARCESYVRTVLDYFLKELP